MDAILKVYTTAKKLINKGNKAHRSDFFFGNSELQDVNSQLQKEKSEL